MKVVMVNGSPHKDGNTAQALRMVAAELEAAGIETSLIQVGGKDVKCCIACGMCRKNQDRRCVLKGDDLNEWIAEMAAADGLLFGSPVHFSGISAAMKAFMDRAFYVSTGNGNLFRHKVGAGVIAVRRSGGTAAFEQLNQYILYSEMLVPTSNYWNVIHGRVPGEVAQDAEGSQIMRVLGRNMAWLLKLSAGEKAAAPAREDKVMTNFVR